MASIVKVTYSNTPDSFDGIFIMYYTNEAKDLRGFLYSVPDMKSYVVGVELVTYNSWFNPDPWDPDPERPYYGYNFVYDINAVKNTGLIFARDYGRAVQMAQQLLGDNFAISLSETRGIYNGTVTER